MRPLIVGLLSLVLMYGAATAAVRLRMRLPEHHLSEAAKDAVTRSIAFVVTLAVLVLSLLIASGKASHEEISAKLRQLASEFLVLDRNLALYGPETGEARLLLRQTMATAMRNIWPDADVSGQTLQGQTPRAAIDQVHRRIKDLVPATAGQTAIQAEALRGINEIKRTGWLLIELSETHMPTIFLVIIVLWLVVVFFGFGLFSPRNRTVSASLLFCAICAACAVFLVLELYAPVQGLLAISPRAFALSLEQLGH